MAPPDESGSREKFPYDLSSCPLDGRLRRSPQVAVLDSGRFTQAPSCRKLPQGLVAAGVETHRQRSLVRQQHDDEQSVDSRSVLSGGG